MKEQIKEIIKDAIEELNEQLDDNQKIEFNEETHFIGSNAKIDSMSFVTLISIIEELIADKLNKDIKLVNDKAFSSKNSPFYSIATLTDYIETLINEAK